MGKKLSDIFKVQAAPPPVYDPHAALYGGKGPKWKKYNYSAFENKVLKNVVEPGKDFIYDYSGKSGERLTDVNAIMGMIQRGEIQTSVNEFMGYFSEKSREKTQVADWNLDTYRAATLVDAVGGFSETKGGWGWFQFNPGSEKAQKKQMKGLAEYIAATNLEFNTLDIQNDIKAMKDWDAAEAELEKRRKQAALDMVGGDPENQDDSKQAQGLRYKTALRGMSTADILARGQYAGATPDRMTFDQAMAIVRQQMPSTERPTGATVSTPRLFPAPTVADVGVPAPKPTASNPSPILETSDPKSPQYVRDPVYRASIEKDMQSPTYQTYGVKKDEDDDPYRYYRMMGYNLSNLGGGM
jgi:hypothetical protein